MRLSMACYTLLGNLDSRPFSLKVFITGHLLIISSPILSNEWPSLSHTNQIPHILIYQMWSLVTPSAVYLPHRCDYSWCTNPTDVITPGAVYTVPTPQMWSLLVYAWQIYSCSFTLFLSPGCVLSAINWAVNFRNSNTLPLWKYLRASWLEHHIWNLA